MGKRVVVESGRDRRALVADAGWSQLSLLSVLAGSLVAYGAFVLLAGIAGGILEATGADTDITARWDELGVGAGLVVAGLLFVSYLFGGYVAGRMARRAGLVQGLGVFVLGVLVVAVVAVAIRQLAGTDAVVESLRDLGLPTTGDEWADVGTVAGVASLAGALVGALLGGLLGERWHAKLLSRAIDPDVGAEADARRASELAAAEARVRHGESQERVDTASLRGLRDAPDADRDRGVVASGWARRDRDLDEPAARDADRREADRGDAADRDRVVPTEDEPATGTRPTRTGGPGLRREAPARDADGWVTSDRGGRTVDDDGGADRDGDPDAGDEGLLQRLQRSRRENGRPR